LKLDNPILENGQAAGSPGLLTIPQNKYNGVISGLFSPTDIFRGDHFQALVGCQYQATDCFVTFELQYELGGGFVTIWRTKEKYDGLMTQVDVDLTRIANLKNARVVLTVLASGPAGGDQPIWVAPRIVRNVSGGGDRWHQLPICGRNLFGKAALGKTSSQPTRAQLKVCGKQNGALHSIAIVFQVLFKRV